MVSYTVESLHGGKWICLGNARSSAGAQIWMRDYQKRNPTIAYRVVEEPSRRIVVLHDPNVDVDVDRENNMTDEEIKNLVKEMNDLLLDSGATKIIRCPSCGHVVKSFYDHVDIDIDCEHDMTEEEIAKLMAEAAAGGDAEEGNVS